MKKYTLKNDSYTAQLSGGILKPFAIALDHLIHPKLVKERNSIQFLYGHHLFKDEIENFKTVTSYLARHFKIISYSEAVALLKTGDIDDNYLCFSFDDGMKNCMRIAEHFNELGISAMFFINPEVVDNFDNESYIQKHCSEKLHLKELDFMGWHDITLLLKMGHEVGNHTLSHQRLSAIQPEACSDEIIKSKERIEKHAGPVKHFAWTYGLKSDITPEAFKMIVQSGHESVASAIRGQHFDILNLKKEYILRDQIIYKNPFYYFNYFFNKGNKIAKR
jgi:peptidoglycan/xylan/chitin deacetylase (PgdA/CDA1 family)